MLCLEPGSPEPPPLDRPPWPCMPGLMDVGPGEKGEYVGASPPG